MANIPFLKTYGLDLISDEILRKRIVMSYDFEPTESNIANFLRGIGIYDAHKHKLEIIPKIFGIADGQTGPVAKANLDWHIDDHVVSKRKGAPTFNLDRYTLIKPNTYLFRSVESLPLYTIVFYTSTQGIEFTGGDFCFADDVVVHPTNNTVIMFDSREVHCVKHVTSGTRTSILVKIKN